MTQTLNPPDSLDSQLELFYGKESGWVYSPTLNRSTSEWDEENYFMWPRDKQRIIDHVARNSPELEVYISPALYNSASNNVVDVKGSYTVWVDFDGNAPTNHQLETLQIPKPTWRVKSSNTGYEHWYWKLNQFSTNVETIEGINRSLTYALEGDIGGWRSNKVLRPVASINHKRGGVPVLISARQSFTYALNHFEVIPVPVSNFKEDDFDAALIPNAMDVILEYSITDPDLRELLRKPSVKRRSDALMRIAYDLAELGMDNNQIFAVVRWVDARPKWRKFADRADPDKCYIEIINYARQKVPYSGVPITPGNGLKTYGYLSLMSHTDDTKYLIDGLLPETGLMYIAAPSESGKTLLATEMCMRLSMGSQLFNWRSETGMPLRVLFLSLEMPKEDLKRHWVDKLPNLSHEQQALLEANFQTYAEPEIIRFYDMKDMQKLLATIEEYKPHILLVDSATVALSRNLNDFEDVQRSLNLLYVMRNRFKFAMIVIAHTRKNPPSHGLRETDLDDLFGSQAIAASASSVIGIRRDRERKPKLVATISYLKTRFKGDHQTFTVEFDGSRHTFIKPSFGELEASKVDIVEAVIPVARGTKDRNSSGFLDV